jgi:hypothetical protein
MAITSSITVQDTVDHPEDYTPATLSEIADAESSEFTTDIAISNADLSNPSTGLTNVLTAVKAFFDNDFSVNTLKLNTTAAITANIYVRFIRRMNTADSIYLTGTEVFRVTALVKYS